MEPKKVRFEKLRQKMPTWDQIKGMSERVILLSLMAAVSAEWIGQDDAEVYGPAVLLLVGTVYAWFVNRPKAIVQSAAALPGTTVITTADLAKSTPEDNIVSRVENVVERKPEEEITRDLNRAEAARDRG